jgi:hypothetical protein
MLSLCFEKSDESGSAILTLVTGHPPVSILCRILYLGWSLPIALFLELLSLVDSAQ